MKNLKQKLATGIVWLGGLAGIVGIAGCESPEGNMGLAALGNMAQVSPYATPDDRMFGAGLSTIGQMGHNMNTAKAGRSEVNVNVDYPTTHRDNSSPYNYLEPYSSADTFNKLINLENRKSIEYYGKTIKPTREMGHAPLLGLKLLQKKDGETRIIWLKPFKCGEVQCYNFASWNSAPEYIRNLKIDE